MLPKIVSGAIMLTMSSGEVPRRRIQARIRSKGGDIDSDIMDQIMENPFLKNFKGFNKQRLKALIAKYKRSDVVRDWQEEGYISGGKIYAKVDKNMDIGPDPCPSFRGPRHRYLRDDRRFEGLELDMEKIPDFNLDPVRCLQKARDNYYSEAFYKNEERHIKQLSQYTPNESSRRFLWINHVMRHYFPNHIRFNEWSPVTEGTMWDSHWVSYTGAKMWDDIIDHDDPAAVWEKFVKIMTRVFMWNTLTIFNQQFKSYPQFMKEVYNTIIPYKRSPVEFIVEENFSLHKKISKYYNWLTLDVFSSGGSVRSLEAKLQQNQFGDDVDSNQIIIAKFIEILQFVKSDECVNYLHDKYWRIMEYLNHQDNLWRLSWFPVKSPKVESDRKSRKTISKMAKEMRMLMRMLRSIKLVYNIRVFGSVETLQKAGGKVPEKFRKKAASSEPEPDS